MTDLHSSRDNVPLPWVESDGPWMLHASSDQRGAHVSIKLGNLDLIQIAVDPVEFSGDPVHGQALRGGQTVLHHHFDSCHPWNNNTSLAEKLSRKKVWRIVSCSTAELFFS